MLTRQPVVSVVVPCLNREEYVGATIDSILGQDYPSVECIVMDGGSTNGTVDVLRSYGDKIRWVSKPDGGHSAAINSGWRRSAGDILAWLNADDLWKRPDAVAQAVEFLATHDDVDIVYGRCGAVNAEGRVIGESYLHEWDLPYAVEFCDHCIPQPASFIRRSIVEKVGWLDESIASGKDHDLWLRVGLVGRIEHHPVTLAYERATPGTWADRGDLSAQGKIALTKKFFALPNVPVSIQKLKRRSISNTYLKAGEYAWSGGKHWLVWMRCLLFAFLWDPTNLKRLWHGARTPLATEIVRHRKKKS